MATASNIVKAVNMMKEIEPNKDGFGFVYELMNGNECIYVGQTVDLKSRLYSHLSSRKEFDSVIVNLFSCIELNNEEANRIVDLNPVLNKNLPVNDRFVSVEFLRDAIYESLLWSGLSADHVSKHNKKEYISVERAKEICKEIKSSIEKLNMPMR